MEISNFTPQIGHLFLILKGKKKKREEGKGKLIFPNS